MLMRGPLLPATAAHPPESTSRARAILCWTGAMSCDLEINAPAEVLFAAYADIERMPEWSPLLVRFTPPASTAFVHMRTLY